VTRDRRNGQKQSQPICVWNGILEKKHRDRLGKSTALWLYLEMLDKITQEDAQGIGWLLGKKPIKLEEFGGNVLTNRRHFKKLLQSRYIVARRTPYGNVIGVTNSRKLRFGRVSGSAQSGVSSSARSQGESDQFSVATVSSTANYKEDNAVDNAVKERAASSVWKETGVDPLGLPGPFRKLCEELWPVRSGRIFEFMGLVLDAWQALGSTKYPPAWVKRKAELGRTSFAKRESELLELESIPWQK
jgi:hypothetical protein